MRKRIHLHAFSMTCVSHIQHGLWVRAAVMGAYDIYRGGVETVIVEAMQIPANDPAPLIPAMAYATEHLGFRFGSTTVFWRSTGAWPTSGAVSWHGSRHPSPPSTA